MPMRDFSTEDANGETMREDGIDFQELVEWLPAVVYVAAPGVDTPRFT